MDAQPFRLSWGQQFFDNIMVHLGAEQWREDLFIDKTANSTLSVAAVTRMLGHFLESHPILRSVIHDREPVPRQRIVNHGTVDLALHDSVAADGLDRDALVARLVPDGLPVAGALLVQGNHVSRLILRVSHRVTDWWGIELLRADLATRLGSLQNGEPLTFPGSLSPAEVVDWECSAEGRAANERALSYRSEQLAGAPPTMFPHAPLDYSGAPYWFGELRSPKLLSALSALQLRERVLPGAALAGALAVAASVATGIDHPVLHIWSANRFRREWRDYPGPLSQIGVLRVDQSAEQLLAELRSLNGAVLRAGMNSLREPPSMGAGRDQIGLNVLLTPADVSAADDLESTPEGTATFRWLSCRTEGEDLGVFILVHRSGHEVVMQLRIGVDTINRADGELLLRGMEQVILQAAGQSCMDLERFRAWWMAARAELV
jgi:hypothetical protein